MKKPTIIMLAIVLLTGVAAVSHLIHRSRQPRIGSQHIFQLSEQPAFLTEELALAKARETLTLDGLDASVWQPQRDGGTTAPDGRADEFASRNTLNSNRVVIAFTSSVAGTRFVSVELDGSRVVCQTSLGK